MVRELNLDALGMICVSERSNGSYAIIDGQHRVASLRAWEFTTEPVHCEVYKGLTVAEEAAMYRLRNNRMPVTKLDLYRSRLIEGDPVAVGIRDVLDYYGWTVHDGRNNGWISCIETVETIYRNDPAALHAVMRTITNAFGRAQAGVNRSIVAGLGKIFARYGQAVNAENLSERMAKLPGGADALIGRARGLRDNYRVPMSDAMAEILVIEYNKRRSSTSLAHWRSD